MSLHHNLPSVSLNFTFATLINILNKALLSLFVAVVAVAVTDHHMADNVEPHAYAWAGNDVCGVCRLVKKVKRYCGKYHS